MALNLSKSFTFSPSTTIASSEVNTDFDTLYNAFTGIEAGTSTLAKLIMDADPTTALAVATKQYVDAYANYKRPQLTFVSTSTVDVSENTGTANQTKIVFPDGNYRSVTENTGVTTKYRRFDITATAEFTSGTEESGLYTGLSETANTWYAIYAVKSLINTSNFVLVGTTTLPVQASFSTLNTNLGTNGWVYLGLIKNGDEASSTTDIVGFDMAGHRTSFKNTCIGNSQNGSGIRVATSAGATTLTYTYAAGTGAAQIPANVPIVTWTTNATSSGANFDARAQGGTNIRYMRLSNTPGTASFMVSNVSSVNGLINETSSSTAKDIYITGFVDSALGVGSNPLI